VQNTVNSIQLETKEITVTRFMVLNGLEVLRKQWGTRAD